MWGWSLCVSDGEEGAPREASASLGQAALAVPSPAPFLGGAAGRTAAKGWPLASPVDSDFGSSSIGSWEPTSEWDLLLP